MTFAQNEAKRAEEAAQAKEQFIANINHELRTHLNAILGCKETNSDERLGPLGNPKYQEYATHIHESGGYLLSFINDTIDIARMSFGHFDFEPAEYLLSDMIGESFELIENAAKNVNVVLERENVPDSLMIYGDRRAIKQVVINLLPNAVESSKDGEKVSVFASQKADGTIEVVVSNSGIGIPDTEIESIFEPFVRLDESATGTGLGLPLVKGIIYLHAGSIEIESEVGSGTIVRILFPPKPPGTKTS